MPLSPPILSTGLQKRSSFDFASGYAQDERFNRPFMLSVTRVESKHERLQCFGGVIRQPRALAAHERDVPAVGPPFHPVHDIGEAGAPFGEIRGIDLCNITQ